MGNEPNWPAIAKKLREIKDSNDPAAYDSAMEMVRSKFGINDASEIANKVKGSNVIDAQTLKTMKGGDWQEKIADLLALKKMSKVGKKIPGLGAVVGGLGALAGAEDASAAIPVLSEADDLGPGKQSPEGMFERGEINQEEFMKLANQSQNDVENSASDSYNKDNLMKEVQPMSESETNGFRKLKGILGSPIKKGRNPSVLPGIEYKE